MRQRSASRFRRTTARVLAVVMTLAGAVLGVARPAAAAPDCDVPNPPPLCPSDVFPMNVSLSSAIVRTPAGLTVSGTASVKSQPSVPAGTYCTSDDPNATACRHWESGSVRGDANGIDVPQVVG